MECNYLFCAKITESRRNNYMQIWIRDTACTFVVFAVFAVFAVNSKSLL